MHSYCSLACLAVLLFTGWPTAGAGTASPTYTTCQNQFLAVMAANGDNNTAATYVDFIDTDTPDSACTLQLCQGNYTVCDPMTHGSDNPPNTSSLVLVFSDEFQQEGRSFGVKDGDPRWTAQDMYYFPTGDLEVYKPEQVTTWQGKAVITMEHLDRPASAVSLQPDGSAWNVAKNFKSGLMSGWNKWCYTGGYVEVSVRLPGDDQVPGFWPAFWAMGNLGRAGYMPSTNGFWPYSFDTCTPPNGTTQQNSVPGSQVPSQLISACPSNASTPGYINRTLYFEGSDLTQARCAPEFDVFEVIVNSGAGATASQTLQMAPLLPMGQSWADLAWYDANGLSPEGVQYPGGVSALRTQGNQWSGPYGRPGNTYQDSMSAESSLDPTFYTGYHTFGVDWAPGEYMRWYVDGLFAYEINPNALVARTGPGADGMNITIGQRIIPVEPMYLLFNLGMSESFGEVDLQNLAFPAWMLVEYVRVYQRPEALSVNSVGCSPPLYPTEQWIACHKENYMTSKDDEVLVKAACQSAAGRGALPGAALVAAAMTLLVLL